MDKDFIPVRSVYNSNYEVIKNIMCDLPFVICGKSYKSNKEGSSVIAKRFEGYVNYSDLKRNYYNTLKELYRICDKDGFVVFKCQDSVSGGLNYFTHCMVFNMALEFGFYPRDLFVLVAKMRINSFGGKWNKQEHARKFHSFYWVFEKRASKKDFNFYNIFE
jgi:hypothetical protein